MPFNTSKLTPSSYSGWLPANPQVYDSFLNKHATHAKDSHKSNQPHTDAVAKFEATIKENTAISFLFDQIFSQVPSESPVQDFDHLLYTLNRLITTPPSFHLSKDLDSYGNPISEPIESPLFFIYDALRSAAGPFASVLLRQPPIKDGIQELVEAWCGFLRTPNSITTLTDTSEGWFGPIALPTLEEGRGKFNDTYVCPDPSAVNRGFASWDAFFSREIQMPARVIESPENKSLLHNACESTVYHIAERVRETEKFYLKGEAYTLLELLGRDAEYVPKFVGGTVYQAFLSPQDYHRWRSPIDGTIVKVVNIPGRFYADTSCEETDIAFGSLTPSAVIVPHTAAGMTIPMTAARTLIYIESNDSTIGLICFIGVGMTEISSCDPTVCEGDEVKIGDELGMFHFGGSAYTLIFGPQIRVDFSGDVRVNQHLHVNRVIGKFSKA